ncbi:MAG: exosortase C-terminal domain/associated protein EpsI [Pseudomonadota bacterium]
MTHSSTQISGWPAIDRRMIHALAWLCILSAAFIAAFWIPLSGIVNTWASNDDYSFGYLIPFISMYLFWDMRHRLKDSVISPSWGVLPVLAAAAVVSVYGILGSSGNVSRPLVPIVFMLSFALVFGLPAFKRFFLPLGFLVFMVPLPALLDRTIGVFLKSVSSQLGGMIIRASGLSVFVNGNVIDLGVTQLQVVDACSGLRFVFPLVALGVMYAYLFESARWKQAVCVAATIPIAILMNAVRIGLTGILTHFYGPKVAEGFFHDFSGWVVFMAAFAVLFLLGRILRWFPTKMQAPVSVTSSRGKSETAAGGVDKWSKPALGAALGIFLVVGGFSLSAGALPPVVLTHGIGAFPMTINGWHGHTVGISPEIIEASGAEEAFFADYSNGTGNSVSLYVGYRSSAFLENENFFHSPTVCLPSSGWKTTDTATRVITDVPGFGKLTVTQMTIESMGVRQLVYFWFQTKRWATHSKNINRLHLALHAIKRDNTHDLFIRTISRVSSTESDADAEARMDDFVRSTLASMDQFLKTNIASISVHGSRHLRGAPDGRSAAGVDRS